MEVDEVHAEIKAAAEAGDDGRVRDLLGELEKLAGESRWRHNHRRLHEHLVELGKESSSERFERLERERLDGRRDPVRCGTTRPWFDQDFGRGPNRLIDPWGCALRPAQPGGLCKRCWHRKQRGAPSYLLACGCVSADGCKTKPGLDLGELRLCDAHGRQQVATPRFDFVSSLFPKATVSRQPVVYRTVGPALDRAIIEVRADTELVTEMLIEAHVHLPAVGKSVTYLVPAKDHPQTEALAHRIAMRLRARQ